MKKLFGWQMIDLLNEPYSWKKSRVVFVNSMSDLFHEDVPIDFIREVFRVMRENSQHVFQVLTKRTELALEYDRAGCLDWTDNIWLGTSVEDEQVTHRIDQLGKTGAKTKFLSCEPLIGPLSDMNLTGINWVIVGGESGYRPRPMKPDWVIDIKDQCEAAGVPFFFKQWGGRNKKKEGRLLFEKTWDALFLVPPSIGSKLDSFIIDCFRELVPVNFEK